MKNIVTAILLFCTFSAHAQGGNFYSDNWKFFSLVKKYKERELSLFHRDSSKNKLDYKRYGIKFASNSTYKGTNETGSGTNGTWSINKTKDTMTIDGYAYILKVLNTNYITLRTMSLGMVDTSGTLDTMYTDMTLYSLPDLTTSHFENALGSAQINVFPNPARQNVEIQISGLQQGVVGKLLLADLRGQVLKTVVWDPTAQAQTIDLEQLHAGFYLLEIVQHDGRRIAVKKIMKE